MRNAREMNPVLQIQAFTSAHDDQYMRIYHLSKQDLTGTGPPFPAPNKLTAKQWYQRLFLDLFNFFVLEHQTDTAYYT